ncbi:hypothetical protein [Desulfosporosinus fructosivorans]
MFGEQYFRDRLFGIYEFSPISYLSGTGELLYDNTVMPIQWEFVVAITGEQLLALHYDGFVDPNIIGNPALSLNGSSNCGTWDITIPSMQVFDISMSSSIGVSNSIKCYAREIFIRQRGTSQNQVDHIEGLIRNFDFLGSDVTQEGSRRTLDQINVTILNKEIRFRTIQESDLIKEQIKSKRIDRALLSTMTIPLAPNETSENLYSLQSSICWFLSLLNINACMCPIVRHWAGSELQQIHVRDLISSPYHRNVIIDNHEVRHGIRNILNNCYDEFARVDSVIDMRLFVSNLLGMYEGKFLEHKLVGLVLSYEFLLTRYLVYLGHNLQEVTNLSIQDKLRRLNNSMRFISSRLLGDNLREQVRNPIFHTGEISMLNVDEKISIYKEYLDLLIQIVLRIVGYNDGYISPIDYRVRPI